MKPITSNFNHINLSQIRPFSYTGFKKSYLTLIREKVFATFYLRLSAFSQMTIYLAEALF